MDEPFLNETTAEYRSVPVAGYLICDSPRVVLCAEAVGTGMALAGYDPVAQVGGLFHAPLPTESAGGLRRDDRPAMFVDTALPALIDSLRKAGAHLERMVFFAVGGSSLVATEGALNIGERNRRRLVEVLEDHGLKLMGDHLGGHSCRAFYLGIGNGEALVRVPGKSGKHNLCPR